MTATKCRGCGKPIGWVKMESGKWMPVQLNRHTIVTDDGFIRQGRESHYSYCSEAEKFRKGPPG